MNHRIDGRGKPMPKQYRDYAETQQHDCDTWMYLAVQAAGVALCSWDIACGQVELTESARRLHGFPCDVQVSYRAWLMTLHSDDQEPTQQAMQHALDENTNYRSEYRLIHADGSVSWIAAQGKNFFVGAGKSLRLMGALFDVTAHKQAEQALKDKHQTLTHMARVSTLGDLSAALAHELNQPLTAILCNAQAAQRFLTQTQPDLEELRAILVDIVADDQRASSVVSCLRALFKKEESTQQVLDINALVEEVTLLLRSELIGKQIFLCINLSAELPNTKGDPVQIRQVLLNLIMNGIEAMASSAPALLQLRISTSQFDTDSLEISVCDSGPGISPQILEQIFEPFVTDKAHGLGMGLAISRAIVAAHGGRLWADNTPASGAALRFTLPITQEL